MKRNRSIEHVLNWKLRHWGPEYKNLKNVIPPLSVVRLAKREPDWGGDLKIGDVFRIGYYGRHDGINCVWLVDEQGVYEQTWDQVSLLDYFDVVELSNETDIFGNNRPKIRPLS